MDLLPILLVTLIFCVIMGSYFLYLTRPQKKASKCDQVDLLFVKNKWAEIQAMIKSGGPANIRQSIIESDKLVDLVLKSRVSGETMGERLKNSRKMFRPEVYDQLWVAHKIRNKVAHEANFEGLSFDANLAVRNFERALKELEVL